MDSVRFIRSRVWADEQGRNRCGVVVIQEQQLFAAREVAKVDARPGGYVAAGGHGGIVGNISHTGRIALTYLPVFKHTYRSDLKITTLPNAVKAAKKGPRGIEMVDVAVKDGNGKLLPDAIPVVTISADGSYSGMDYGHDTAPEIDLIASIEHKLSLGLLTGFVIQGLVPYGRTPSHTRNKLMLKAAFSGIPVAIAGRGAPMGFADPIGLPDRRHQSHRQQGPLPVDGLPAEVREPAGGERSRQADKRGVGRHPQSRRGLSGGVQYALTGRRLQHLRPEPVAFCTETGELISYGTDVTDRYRQLDISITRAP